LQRHIKQFHGEEHLATMKQFQKPVTPFLTGRTNLSSFNILGGQNIGFGLQPQQTSSLGNTNVYFNNSGLSTISSISPKIQTDYNFSTNSVQNLLNRSNVSDPGSITVNNVTQVLGGANVKRGGLGGTQGLSNNSINQVQQALNTVNAMNAIQGNISNLSPQTLQNLSTESLMSGLSGNIVATSVDKTLGRGNQ